MCQSALAVTYEKMKKSTDKINEVIEKFYIEKRKNHF